MMQEDAGVSIAAGGWLASANYVGYLLGAVSMMGLRIRQTTAIRAGLITISVATFGMGLHGGFALWIVLRAVAGVASAWVLINVSAWCLERLTPLHRPGLSGTVFAGVGAGITLAGVLCLALMHVHASSARTWIVFGIFSVVLSVGIWRVYRPDVGAASRHAENPRIRAVAWDTEWTRLVFCYGAFGFGYIIPATFLPVMAKQVIPDPAIFGWSWPMFGAAATLSALATTVLPHGSNRRLWIACHLAMALGIALPVIWSAIAAIMLAALFVGGTFMVITMVGMQEARDAAGVHAPRLMAAMTSAFGFGQIAGPLIVRSVVVGGDRGFSLALLIASSLLVISACGLSRSCSLAGVPRLFGRR